MLILAAGHLSAASAHALAWLVIVVVILCAVRGLFWLLGWH